MQEGLVKTEETPTAEQEEGAIMLCSFLMWWSAALAIEDLLYAAGLMEGVAIGLDEWSLGKPDRVAFSGPARSFLNNFILDPCGDELGAMPTAAAEPTSGAKKAGLWRRLVAWLTGSC